MEPLAPKKTKKALFSSRLAGVNVQTPRHTKMQILADIIRRACNRFNIDPEDLFEMIMTRMCSRNHHHAHELKVMKKRMSMPWTLQKDAITAMLS